MPASEREVLEERARALARPVAAQAADTTEFVTFSLAGETWAIESRYALEVFRLANLARLPGAEPPVFGITTWRGALLTILDLRLVLGLSAASLDDLGRVIVLGKEAPAFGILADQVHGLVAVRASEMREPPEGVAVQRDYVQGVTGDAMIVLAAEQLLAFDI